MSENQKTRLRELAEFMKKNNIQFSYGKDNSGVYVDFLHTNQGSYNIGDGDEQAQLASRALDENFIE